MQVKKDTVSVLDIDGVLNVQRVQFSRPKRANVFDPVAVKYLKRLLRLLDAQLLISSIWRLRGRDVFIKEASLSGFKGIEQYLDDTDWCTSITERGARVDEIMAKLACLSEAKFVIVLDDEFLGGKLHHAGFKSMTVIRTDIYNGILFNNYLELDAAFEEITCLKRSYLC